VGYVKARGADNFTGQLAEILYYQRNSCSSILVDTAAVETYLYNKYGI